MMFYEILEAVMSLFYGAETVIANTSYEYWLAVVISGIVCVLAVGAPFFVIRWFFRGL